METDKLVVDDVTPTDRALLIDMRDSVLMSHGGLATQIVFKKAVYMSLDDFIKNDVPGLADAKNRLTVIRDSISNRNYVIYNDGVLRYDDCTLNDVELDKMASHIQKLDGTVTFMPNIDHPLISIIDNKTKGLKNVVVSLDNYSFEFKDDRLGVSDRLYMPPLWFGLTMTSANDILAMRVAVARDKYPNCKDTKLQALPLPNIYPSGRICTGASKVNIGLGDNPTDGEIINLSLTRFFNSGWNTHLMNNSFSTVLGGSTYPVYMALENIAPEVKAKYDALVSKRSSNASLCGQYRVLAVLTQPKGWMNCAFERLTVSTEGFMLGEE